MLLLALLASSAWHHDLQQQQHQQVHLFCDVLPGQSELVDAITTAEEGDLFSPNADGEEVVFTSNTSPDVRAQIVVGTPGNHPLLHLVAAAAIVAAAVAAADGGPFP